MSDQLAPTSVTVTAPVELAYPLTDEFAGRLTELDPCGELVVDLRDVRFMDSCGLRLLLTERARRAQVGGTIAVSNPPSVVRRLFEITGVGVALPFTD